MFGRLQFSPEQKRTLDTLANRANSIQVVKNARGLCYCPSFLAHVSSECLLPTLSPIARV